MRLPTKAIEPSERSRRLTGYVVGNRVERGMNSRSIEVLLKLSEFPLEGKHAPEQDKIEKLVTERADEPLDERTRCARPHRTLFILLQACGAPTLWTRRLPLEIDKPPVDCQPELRKCPLTSTALNSGQWLCDLPHSRPV